MVSMHKLETLNAEMRSKCQKLDAEQQQTITKNNQLQQQLVAGVVLRSQTLPGDVNTLASPVAYLVPPFKQDVGSQTHRQVSYIPILAQIFEQKLLRSVSSLLFPSCQLTQQIIIHHREREDIECLTADSLRASYLNVSTSLIISHM